MCWIVGDADLSRPTLDLEILQESQRVTVEDLCFAKNLAKRYMRDSVVPQANQHAVFSILDGVYCGNS